MLTLGMPSAFIDYLAKLQVQPELGASKRIDALEAALVKYPQIDMPVVHRFTPGLYMREIHMPAGSLCTSKIHKTEHPFVVLSGRCSVWSEGNGVEHICAPFVGITKPGSRRVLYIHEDTVWITFHVTDKTSISDIEDDIIVPHYDHLGLSQDELSALRVIQHVTDKEVISTAPEILKIS